MRPALKREPNMILQLKNGMALDINTLPDCQNCYNACALKVRGIDATGSVIKKCARSLK